MQGYGMGGNIFRMVPFMGLEAVINNFATYLIGLGLWAACREFTRMAHISMA